jgi:hypothetical protein
VPFARVFWKRERTERSLDVDRRPASECQIAAGGTVGVDADEQFEIVVPHGILGRTGDRVRPLATTRWPDEHRLPWEIFKRRAGEIEPDDAGAWCGGENLAHLKCEPHSRLC